MKSYKYLLYLGVASLTYTGCKPRIAKDEMLPSPSPANFTIEQYIDPAFPQDRNTFIFKNSTDGGFLSSWDFGGIEKSLQSLDTIFFAYKGKYQVRLTSGSKGGSSTIIKELEIAETSPYASDFDIVSSDQWRHNLLVKTPAAFVDSLLWTYSDGVVTNKKDTSAYFPWQGKQTVSLRVFTKKGTSILTKDVVIDNDDNGNPALNDLFFTNLTGGLSDLDGKTWVMDPTPDRSGVGPYLPNAIDLAYYKYPLSDGSYAGSPAWKNGAMQNEFTFRMRDYLYSPKNSTVTMHWAFANRDFRQNQAQYADIALADPKHAPAPFILKNEGIGITGYTLRFGNGSYMAYYDARYNYEIAKLTADSLFVRHKYTDDPKAKPSDDANQRLLIFTVKK